MANIRYEIPWDDSVSATNKVESQANIQRNSHLDKQGLKEKRLFKMTSNFCDNQTDKKASQAYIASQAKSSSKDEKFFWKN